MSARFLKNSCMSVTYDDLRAGNIEGKNGYHYLPWQHNEDV